MIHASLSTIHYPSSILFDPKFLPQLPLRLTPVPLILALWTAMLFPDGPRPLGNLFVRETRGGLRLPRLRGPRSRRRALHLSRGFAPRRLALRTRSSLGRLSLFPARAPRFGGLSLRHMFAPFREFPFILPDGGTSAGRYIPLRGSLSHHSPRVPLYQESYENPYRTRMK